MKKGNAAAHVFAFSFIVTCVCNASSSRVSSTTNGSCDFAHLLFAGSIIIFFLYTGEDESDSSIHDNRQTRQRLASVLACYRRARRERFVREIASGTYHRSQLSISTNSHGRDRNVCDPHYRTNLSYLFTQLTPATQTWRACSCNITYSNCLHGKNMQSQVKTLLARC